MDNYCRTAGFVVTRLHCTSRRWVDSPVAGNRTRRFRYQPPDRTQDCLTSNSTSVIAVPTVRFRVSQCHIRDGQSQIS